MEEEQVFLSKVKSSGIFSFKDFYKFCYDWLSEEMGLEGVSEGKYSEKLSGDTKNIDIEWEGDKKLSDYFKSKVKVAFAIKNLSQIKIKKEGAEVDSNKGDIEIKVKGIIVKDYLGKFDMTGFRKFLRSIYEKYVIPSTIKELKTKIITECDEFLGQAKSYLDLEGRKG